nr:unnamed protein product [Digitaria exilis]
MSDLSSSPSPSSSSFALLCSTSFAAAPPQPPWLALHHCERYQEGRSNLEGTPMPVFASLAGEDHEHHVLDGDERMGWVEQLRRESRWGWLELNHRRVMP